MADPSTFSLQEAADIAGVKRATLRQWLERGHIKVERGTGQKRWTWAEVFYAATFAELAKGTNDYDLLGQVSAQTFARFYHIAKLGSDIEADGICIAYRDPKTEAWNVEVFAELSLALQYAGEVLGGDTFFGISPSEFRIFNIKQIEGGFAERLNGVIASRKGRTE